MFSEAVIVQLLLLAMLLQMYGKHQYSVASAIVAGVVAVVVHLTPLIR